MSCCCGKVMRFLGFKKTIEISPVGSMAPGGSYQPQIVQPEPVLRPLPHRDLEPPKITETVTSRVTEPSEPATNHEEPEAAPMRRRSAVPRGPNTQDTTLEHLEIVKHDKDNNIEQLLKTSLTNNDFLKNILDEERLQQVVDAMYPEIVEAKHYVIHEGDYGTHMYVCEDGSFEVTKNGMIVKKFKGGETFGELAILYNTKRFASVQALTRAKVWVLDRNVYQKIMLRTALEEHEANIDFLAKVPQFQKVKPELLTKISNLLKREFFSTGHEIVRQGERGDKFYIIRVGSVLITKRTAGAGAVAQEETVGVFKRGEYFGELALLQEDCRQATVIAQAPGVECLTLDRKNFIKCLGPVLEIGNYEKKRPVIEPAAGRPDYSYIRFDDLDILQTLGVGGFGRVELAQYRNNKKLTFALKYLKKIDMVQQQQQEHAYNEKMIMYNCNSEFICKLYKTFRDAKYIYFLMEVCLGGDVWTMLQKARNRCFDEKMARFMAGCVVEAFDYLHARDIIYRDLKPENLLVDHQGYVKLVDFGFAKKLGPRGKTYTFAGTPEYVAPEIILNRGHDRAVDYWALGIFVHELVAGKPPFRGTDHMKTYNLIIKGIEHTDFPTKMSRQLQVLIRKLCRSVPADRLGCQRNGVDDIREHKWFTSVGFDWEALRSKKMVAPIKPVIKSSVDVSNFDKYPKDTDIPPDEVSGWDKDF